MSPDDTRERARPAGPAGASLVGGTRRTTVALLGQRSARCSAPAVTAVCWVSLLACGAAFGGCLFPDVSALTEPGATADATPSPDAGDDEGGDGDAGEAGLDAEASPCPYPKGAPMVRVSDAHGAFCVDATETTVADWNAFAAAAATPSWPTVCAWKTSLSGKSLALDSLPITRVDWCDAFAYCAWQGKRLCGSRNGKPIDGYAPANDPAVSEWYAACSQSGAQAYAYGATYDPTSCNGCERTTCDGSAPLVVPGSLATCGGGYVGLFDMNGNVAEWEDDCNDGGTTPKGDVCPGRGGGRYASKVDVGCPLINGTGTRGTLDSQVGIRCCAP